MAKKSQAQGHEIDATDAHDWFVNSYVFPGNQVGMYEHDKAYAVLLCACGARKTELLDDDQAKEVRSFNQLPAETVVAGNATGGGEEE